MTTSARYGAFISYSHAASAEVARGLQKWLQTYAKPWWRWRAVNVFRDETDLTAAPALWSRIADALDQSSHFILLASPQRGSIEMDQTRNPILVGRPARGRLGRSRPRRADRKSEAGSDCDAAHRADGRRHRLERSRNTGDFDWSKTDALPRLLSGVFQRRTPMGRPQDDRPNGTPAHQPFAQQFGIHAAPWRSWPRRSAASPISVGWSARTIANIEGRSGRRGLRPLLLACVTRRVLCGSGARPLPTRARPSYAKGSKLTPRRRRQCDEQRRSRNRTS